MAFKCILRKEKYTTWLLLYTLLEYRKYLFPLYFCTLRDIITLANRQPRRRSVLRWPIKISSLRVEQASSSGFFSAGGGHEVVVQVLLKTGKFDIARWPKAVVRFLLRVAGKANLNTKDMNGWTPLLWAARAGHEAVVRLLLDWGARIEAADKWGRTPLLLAAEFGHEAVVRLLQAHIAQPSSTTLP
ncbi:ankyrin repeat-containing domain protein [Fusarium oxysporum]|nr:ankyrin repeat-containing domain protein [Fusarium oxysporum]